MSEHVLTLIPKAERQVTQSADLATRLNEVRALYRAMKSADAAYHASSRNEPDGDGSGAWADWAVNRRRAMNASIAADEAYESAMDAFFAWLDQQEQAA